MMKKIRVTKTLMIVFGIQTALAIVYDIFSFKKVSALPEKQVWALYNPLFGNPTTDSQYIGWRYRKSKWANDYYEAPTNVPIKIFPQKGLYSTHDKSVIDEQMKEINAVGINALVVLWDGFNRTDLRHGNPNMFAEETISMLLDAGESHGVKVCVMIKNYQSRTEETIEKDIEYVATNLSTHKQYLRYNNRPVIFIYDPHACDTVYKAIEKQRKGLNPYFIGTFSQLQHVAEDVESDFDAVYTYFPVNSQTYSSKASKWGIMKKECENRGINFIPGVGTGLEEFQTDDVVQRTKSRKGGKNYKEMWESAITSNNGIVVINSYNNWLDGTNIEPAVNKEGYEFDDEHWSGKKGGPDDFLEMTKEYIKKFHTTTEKDLQKEKDDKLKQKAKPKAKKGKK